MRRLATLLTWVCLLAAPAVMAQRVRIADPQVLSSTGNGWGVDPRTGAMVLSLPMATVDGELPVPILLRMNGTRANRSLDTYVWDARIRRWLLDESEDRERPVYATQHFGYISMPTYYGSVLEPKTFVLEDGQQFREDDLVPLSTAVAGYEPPVTTFNLPTQFGLVAMAASDVKILGLGSVATFSATTAQLGSLAAQVAAVTPVNHPLPSPLTYQVVMDQSKVRVFLFLSEFSAWVPVLWGDRYGHAVTFKWTRTTTNLPAGVTALHGVVATNARGEGLQLEWPRFAAATGTTEQDLLMVNQVGGSWLSMRVVGYPGITLSPGATSLAPVIPGPLGRPTRVEVARAGQLQPAFWQGASELPAVIAPPNPDPSYVKLWAFQYDASFSRLERFTEPNGTVTEFLGTAPLEVVPAETTGAVRQGPMVIQGIAETKSTAVGGEVLRRRWTRSVGVGSTPVVLMEEVFGDYTLAHPKTRLTYAALTNAVAYSN